MADINEIIALSGIKSVEKAKEEVDKLNKALQDTIIGAKNANDALAGSKSMGDMSKKAEAAALANEKVRKAVAATAIEEERLIKIRTQNEAVANKAIATNEKKIQSSDRLSKKITEQSRLYVQLSNQLEIMRKNAQDVGVQYGITSSQFEKASANVVKLDARLKEVDKALGKTTRSVGDYEKAGIRAASGFNPLSNSINQLTRELPAFTFSVQTGFLALSNNIPIFADAISQATAKTKALREEGQKAPSVFSQLVKSFFSWQTAMSLAITLTTIYGKEIGEFFSSLFKGREAMDMFAERQRLIGESLKSTDYSNAIKNVKELEINIKLAKEGLISKESVLKQYNDTLGSTTGEVNSLDAAEQMLVKNGKAIIEMTLYKMAAQLALADAAKEAVKEQEAAMLAATDLERGSGRRVRNQGNLTIGERLRAAFSQSDSESNKTIDAANKRELSQYQQNQQKKLTIAEEFQRKAAKIGADFGLDLLGNGDSSTEKDLQAEARRVQAIALENQIKLAQINKKYQEDIMNNEAASFEARNLALERYNEASLNIADLSRKKEIILATKTSKEIKDGQKTSKAELEGIEIDYLGNIAEMNDAAANARIKILKDNNRDVEAARIENNKIALDNIKQLRDEELASLTIRNGDVEQYEKDKIAIVNKYAILELQLLIKQAEEELKLQEKLGADVTEERAKIAALKLKLSEVGLDDVKKSAQEEIKIEQEKFEKIKELAQEAFDFARALTNASFERNIQRLEKESEAIDERKDREVEAINESLLTEEEKQEKVAILESVTEERQKQLDKRIAEQKRKQAIADKAFALSQIAINTAIGVAKVWGQTGIFGIAAQIPVIAMGALQAAAVLAQPIPEFRHGGEMKHDGLAQFGEVGRELRINPDGSTELTPGTTTVGYVQKGTKFITASETKRILAKPTGIDVGGNSWDVSGIIQESKRSTSEMKKAITSLKSRSTIITRGGWQDQTVRNNKLNNYFKRNL